MLLSSCLVLELSQRLCHMVWHRQVDLPALVIPIQCDVNISPAFSFGGEGVVFFPSCFEMEGIFFDDVLDSKIINCQCKLHWAPVVRLHAGYKLALIIVMLVQSFFSRS